MSEVVSWRHVGNGLLVAAACFVLLDGVPFHGIHDTLAVSGHLDERAISNAILASGALLWPVLFDCVVGYGSVVDQPLLLLALVGPILMTGIQLATSKSFADDVGSPDGARRAEAGIVISAGLSVGILLLGLQKNAEVQRGIRYMLLAVMLAVTVVVPSFCIGQKRNGAHIVVQAGQRVALNFSIGFIIVGVIVAAVAKAANIPTETLRADFRKAIENPGGLPV